MNIGDLITNAQEVDAFSELSTLQKIEADLLADAAIQIHRKRTALRMTQKEFADHIGVSQGMISKWENGDYNFTLKALAEIADALDLNIHVDLSEKQPTGRTETQNNNIIYITSSLRTNSACWKNKIGQSGELNLSEPFALKQM